MANATTSAPPNARLKPNPLWMLKWDDLGAVEDALLLLLLEKLLETARRNIFGGNP